MTESHWVCRICVATDGLLGADLKKWPVVGDRDGRDKHIWLEHGMACPRGDEDDEVARERCRREWGTENVPGWYVARLNGKSLRDIVIVSAALSKKQAMSVLTKFETENPQESFTLGIHGDRHFNGG